MRKLLTLSLVVLFAGGLGACEQQPTTPDAKASHDPGDVETVTADLEAVPTTAAGINGFAEGEAVGTLTITDDEGADKLTIDGTASGLEQLEDDSYLSLFYGEGSTATGFGACEPPEDSDEQLTLEQMLVGSWDVASDGSATLHRTKSGNAYVEVEEVGTVSIRDTRVDAGFGPDAVVACGVVPDSPDA